MAAADGATPASSGPAPPAGERAVSVLWSFVRCLCALVPVYLAGYYGLSISLVLFGLMVYMGWKHSRLEKMLRLKSAMYLLDNERSFTTDSVFRAKRDLPPWVRAAVIHHHLSLSAIHIWLSWSCTAPMHASSSNIILNTFLSLMFHRLYLEIF